MTAEQQRAEQQQSGKPQPVKLTWRHTGLMDHVFNNDDEMSLCGKFGRGETTEAYGGRRKCGHCVVALARLRPVGPLPVLPHHEKNKNPWAEAWEEGKG